MVLSLVVLSVLVFSFEMISASKVPLFRDLGPHFYPMRFSVAQSFKAGELPLWEPRMAMGFPLLANFQSAAFYVPNLLYLVLPFISAIKADFLFHYLVASIGAALILQHWRFSPCLVLVGSLSFAFGGFTVSLVNLLNHFQTAVWLPWLLLLGEKQLASPSRLKTMTLALIATLQFLAGSPEIYLMSVILFLLNGFRIKREGHTSYGKVLSLALMVNALVAGLAMVQILPTLELLREAARYQTPSFQWATDWSLHPVRLLNLFFLDKEVDLTSFDRFQSLFSHPIPLLMSLYMGALFPFGLWAWFLTEDKKKRTVLIAGIAFSLLLSMGGYTPVYRLFYDYFPMVFLGRFPEKIFFVAFALLLYVALQGLARLLLCPSGPRTFRLLLGPTVLCGFLIGLYLFFRISREGLLQLVGSTKGISSALGLTGEPSTGVMFHLERQIALYMGLAALFFLWGKGKVQRSVAQNLIVVIAFFDLYSAHKPYLFLTSQDRVIEKPQVVDSLEDAPFSRIFFISPQSPLHPNIVLFPKAKSPEEYNVFAFQAVRPNTGIFWGIHYMQEMDALWRRSYDRFRQVAKKLPAGDLYSLLGVLNVKYLVSLQELPADSLSMVRYFPEYPLWLYRIHRVVPRAYIAPVAIYKQGARSTIERLAGPGFNPLREVIVDRPIQLLSKNGFTSETTILAYRSRRVSLHASLNASGILVLADSFYPGWRVYVDGKEKEVLRANYFFRGVLLAPGEHQVVFTYEPISLRYGLIVTLFTLLALLILFVKRRIQRR
ncbi:MAG: YfhO family protein [Candidatus Binatia bacterium]